MTEAQVLQSPAEAARLFRAILGCFSKPAVPVAIAMAADAPEPLLPTTAAVLLTLLDYQTPLWLSEELNRDAVRKYLSFHTGAPLTNVPQEAAFAAMNVAELLGRWPAFNLGTHEYPDRSTTIIVQVPSLSKGDAVTVAGPGLAEAVRFQAAEASPALWQKIRNNNELFPIGSDFLFASAERVAAIPRSSRISLMEKP